MADLVRITINLTVRSADDLARMCAATGLNKTDIINRALHRSAVLEELLARGGGHLLLTNADGTQERVYVA